MNDNERTEHYLSVRISKTGMKESYEVQVTTERKGFKTEEVIQTAKDLINKAEEK